MGFVGGIEWMNTYSRKQFRKLFWRMRAAMKKAIKNGGKQQFKFQYDPCSYALNFDDGFCKFEAVATETPAKLQTCSNLNHSAMWVFVLLVKSE